MLFTEPIIVIHSAHIYNLRVRRECQMCVVAGHHRAISCGVFVCVCVCNRTYECRIRAQEVSDRDKLDVAMQMYLVSKQQHLDMVP